jgi:hypothetical protein
MDVVSLLIGGDLGPRSQTIPVSPQVIFEEIVDQKTY